MFSNIPEQSKQPEPTIQSELLPNSQPEQERPHNNTEEDLQALWGKIVSTADSSVFSSAIKEYCLLLLSSADEQLFLNYFVERKFMGMLSQKTKEYRQSGNVLRTVFSLFEFLLKALKKEEQLVYFLVKISQEGFIGQEYVFEEEEDEAYYANFLKLMIRTINAQPRYLSVFFNSREPHFPLLLQLLKMYDCRDAIMQASSQLAVLEISNNPEPILQKYLSNFPFVLFYALYASRLLNQFREVVAEDGGFEREKLQSSLRYLDDFVGNKERRAVDMYANSFLKMVGRHLFEELSSVQEKTVPRAIKTLKVLLTCVLPELKVVKIRIALLCLLAPKIPLHLKKCFESKHIELEHKYWIPETCSEEVVGHCKAIFYNQQPQGRSFIKSINSYIPRTKDNWLHHELNKVSEIIGLNLSLNEPITAQSHQNQSFLGSLEIMIDDPAVGNPLFAALCKTNSQELVYYYLKVLLEVCQLQEAQSFLDFEKLVQLMTSCTSLSLLQVFNNLVVKSKLCCLDSQHLRDAYAKVTEKLIQFVMSKGWKELLARVRDCRLPEYDEQFSTDIYREIQCQILLFVSLRTLLGTGNQECLPFQGSAWEGSPSNVIETIFKCYESGRYGPLVYMILDGQFMNLKNCQEKLINKQELALTETQFVVSEDLLEVVGGNFSASLYLEPSLREYMLREVEQRRELTDRVALELKGMRFEFRYE